MTKTEEKSISEAPNETFDVLFVGLFCFKVTDRVAVMPDGRTPGDPTIAPHIPFLVADPKDVTSGSGWGGNDPALTAQGIYTFAVDKCTIQITKATQSGTLDATQHDTAISKLIDSDPTYQFAGGQIITSIPLGQGTLELLRRPSDGVNVSRLRVDHGGEIVVSVDVQGEANERVLVLKPGSALAIVNLPLSVDPAHTGNPAKLYKKIAASGTFNPATGPKHLPGVPAIGSNYQVFKIGLPLFTPMGGCCPPP